MRIFRHEPQSRVVPVVLSCETEIAFHLYLPATPEIIYEKNFRTAQDAIARSRDLLHRTKNLAGITQS